MVPTHRTSLGPDVRDGASPPDEPPPPVTLGSISGPGLGFAAIGLGGAGYNADGLWLLDTLWVFLGVLTVVAAVMAVVRLVPRREA